MASGAPGGAGPPVHVVMISSPGPDSVTDLILVEQIVLVRAHRHIPAQDQDVMVSISEDVKGFENS